MKPPLWNDLDDLPLKDRASWKLWLTWQTVKLVLKMAWVLISAPFIVIFNRETWRAYRASLRGPDGRKIPSTCRNLDCTPAWLVGREGTACIRCGREAR